MAAKSNTAENVRAGTESAEVTSSASQPGPGQSPCCNPVLPPTTGAPLQTPSKQNNTRIQ